ncbi:hypothetical protein WG66_013694 [Moniliophthora roreri]|nr:hypothetical protein WG66_013694 [Moniliophthora roreri]
MASASSVTTSQPQTVATTTARGGKTHWSSDNNCTLIVSLTEAMHAGFQTNNGGFHTDAYQEAAEQIEAETAFLDESERLGIPKTLESCKTWFTTLKKEYWDIKHLPSLSGFGFDPIKHVITAPESVWTALIKSNLKFNKWQKKPFPLYDEMAALVGGHVATGATAFYPAAPGPPAPSTAAAVSSTVATGSSNGNNGDDKQDTEDEGQIGSPALYDRYDGHEADHLLMCRIHPHLKAHSPCPQHPLQWLHLCPTSGNSSEHPAKRAHGCKPTQSDTSFELADAVCDLACSALGDVPDVGLRTPTHKTKAICALEDDGGLSDHSMTKAFQLISQEVAVADTYLAIDNITCHTCYIEAELDRLD